MVSVPMDWPNMPSEDLFRHILLSSLMARVPVVLELMVIFPGEIFFLSSVIFVLLTLVPPMAVDVVAKLS